MDEAVSKGHEQISQSLRGREILDSGVEEVDRRNWDYVCRGNGLGG